ncbi:hypothetical protein [Marinigracilibium pacificum]|uniref:Uncharacterized protein n=1 Tax=Marinigracilibium pacificum TaxID=2729599 RepID=A0A848J2B6_9BACT|nr:hypothetical protein [Marinigracilibium pacificum]NMM49926.1 hypothetical protein [Marinigracilibium pacificum]
MNKSKIFNYLIELLIVIVGVSIAFWLNTQADSKKERDILNGYYREFLNELEEDRSLLEKNISNSISKQENMIRASQLYQKPTVSIDSLVMYAMEIGNYYFFTPNDITYRSMINSGDLKLITDLSLKRKLTRLYKLYNVIDEAQQNHLQALDENYFPLIVNQIDYEKGEAISSIDGNLLIKNYFIFSINELDAHIYLYKKAMKLNEELDSLIMTQNDNLI